MAYLRRGRSTSEDVAISLAMEGDVLEGLDAWGDEGRPCERFEKETQVEVPEMGRNGGGLMVKSPPKKEEVIVAFVKMLRQPTKHLLQKVTRAPRREPR